MSQKCMEGYYQDDLSGGVQSNDINNAGFMERRQRFLTKSIPQTYKAYPSIFMGQLQTGIFFNEEGMLPDGCDVTIVFTQTTNEFRAFISYETDDIVVTLVSLKLHVKISALMPELVNKLEEKMKHDNARLYAKRFTTTSSIIGKNSAIFCSDSLFSRHSNPQKIYVFFIEGDNFVGRRTKNPYKFSRKWPVASALTTIRTDGRREGANEPTSTSFIKSIRMTINGKCHDGRSELQPLILGH
ncbi:uncharacterized protein LOC131878156 [Tigriopus californicus]|uniref:uncharacterized protein LOC131878156 n=1 Tax=Tigriopus californicus TaxID=6832 RepID=UPI0027DA6EC4|nr:uncharacterized protein LOC131878156 [Tigriopus californicus]